MSQLVVTASALLFASLLLLPLTGCGEEDSGPVPIRYGRETFEICSMIISDPRFAAEIRGGPGRRIHKFDDIGDAINWLEKQPWKDAPETEIWVRDVTTGKTWLDARKAHYLTGQVSPMDYGFGAVADARPGTVSFAEMRKRVLKRGLSSRCPAPNATDHSGHDHGPLEVPASERSGEGRS